MGISDKTKAALRDGLASVSAGNEVAAALDGVLPGDAVPHLAAIGALATVGAPIGALAAMGTGAVDVACALAADVDAALATIQAAHDAEIIVLDARIATLQAKIDALVAAMIVHGQMAP